MLLLTTLIIFITGNLASVYGQNFLPNEYEFERLQETNDDATWVWRSQAKNLKTLRLDQPGKQTVTLTLCSKPATPGGTVEAYIANMRYSNDGPSDTITASINGRKVGSFETVPIYACGNHWNVFYETGKVGRSFSMKEGKYQLKIRAKTDKYGVEFDKINIKTWNQKTGVQIICGADLGGVPEKAIPM